MQDRSIDRLVEPSFASFSCSLLLSVTIIGSAIISNALQSGLIYTLLFGPTSSATQIETAQNTLKAFSETVLGNPTLNKLLFFGFWLLVGLIVYGIVFSIGSTTGGVFAFMQQLHLVKTRKKILKEEFGLRVMLHLIGLILLIFYTVFFIKTLLPFSVLCARITSGLGWNLASIGYFSAGLITLFLSLHLYTVLLRFALLRTRLYGSDLN